MADSSSQNSDSSNSSSQNIQGSYFPTSQYHHMSYPQQQFPYNYQMSSNFPQQFPFNSPGGSNFPQQFPFNSPTGPSFHPQFSSNFPSTYFMPPPNQFQENSSQFPQHSSQIPVVVDDDVEEVGKSTATTKETKAAWSPDEDILLVKAWYNTSTDSIIGNQQKRKDFWEKITAYYNEWKPEDTAARSLSQVKNHYYRMNPDLNKWAGIYNNFWSNRASGQGDDDVLEAAKRALRNDDPKNKDFKFLHVWTMIQTCEKWTPQQMPQNPQKKAKNSETDSPSSTDTGARIRPMGQQRAKRQAKQKAKMTSTVNEDKWKHLQETMNKQMSLQEVQLKLQEEQLKLQHIEFCRQDTSGMSEDQLYNHFTLVAEIKAKYGWK
ncbi:uncharacterized protein LOC131026054 [Salvia miltiorrhiza]|uniref:uncharacterized protein LOC131026054 n=1 Tax=Salvia miltiorrhiza TaxID=226208 RepID=UPI0025ACF838|nr:uncharacterized protein LOC131026054 [Salvia miltiorrhiza]